MSQTTTEILTLDETYRRQVLKVLEEYSGNKAMAAAALGISLKTLYNKLNHWGLNPNRRAFKARKAPRVARVPAPVYQPPQSALLEASCRDAGLRPALAEKLERAGIRTVNDLLTCAPERLEVIAGIRVRSVSVLLRRNLR